MSDGFGNRAVELAQSRTEQEAQAGIAAASLALAGAGKHECVDCGEPIGEARRRAMPSADRCVGCKERVERGGR